MAIVHPTALVDPGAELAADVTIGAYSIVGADVTIDAGTVVGPHVVIAPRTSLFQCGAPRPVNAGTK